MTGRTGWWWCLLICCFSGIASREEACIQPFGFSASSSSCSKYFYCDSLGVSQEGECEKGKFWNKDLELCDWEGNVTCGKGFMWSFERVSSFIKAGLYLLSIAYSVIDNLVDLATPEPVTVTEPVSESNGTVRNITNIDNLLNITNIDNLLNITNIDNLLCLSLLVAAENVKEGDPDLSKIKFFLWTMQNPEDFDTVELTQVSLENSHFDSSRPTIILAHGWNSHGDGFGANYSEAYFSRGLDYNVFAIEWGDLETWANYPQAVVRTRAVGEHSANLVKILSDVGAFKRIHLIGHSLGAHVAGFLAKKVQAMGLGMLERVTGLDPAEPCFNIAGPAERIDKSDAKFVDIIHTNSGMLWNGCLSIKKPIGHVDIYPAGGVHQPGCVEACIIPNILCLEDLIKGGCSHERSNSYYKESILAGNGGEQFLAWNCASWEDFQSGKCCGGEQVVMGEWIDTRIQEGKYFLQVKEESPFAMSEAGNAYNCNEQ